MKLVDSTELIIDAFDTGILNGLHIIKQNRNLERITVDINNPLYKSIDGVLFLKNKPVLLYYPCGSKRTRYTIPYGIKTIYKEAFSKCQFLKKIEIPKSMTCIDSKAFAFCDSIETVILSDYVNTINSEAFFLCRKLKIINIPDKVSVIGQQAFDGCISMESITIPDSMSVIDFATFMNCKSLKRVKLSSNLKRISNSAFCNSGIESIIIPDSVELIQKSAFLGCTKLKSVSMSESTDIDENVFNYCKLEKYICGDMIVNTHNLSYEVYSCGLYTKNFTKVELVVRCVPLAKYFDRYKYLFDSEEVLHFAITYTNENNIYENQIFLTNYLHEKYPKTLEDTIRDKCSFDDETNLFD